jgi:hypothetical protein
LKNQGIGGREVEIRERVFKVGLGVILNPLSIGYISRQAIGNRQ